MTENLGPLPSIITKEASFYTYTLTDRLEEDSTENMRNEIKSNGYQPLGKENC